jgi:phosphoserine phosphatase RsbU/P
MGHLRNFEISVFRRVRREPPTGRIHRIAFWLFLAYLIFFVGQLLPKGAGLFFRAVSDITLLVLIVFCIPLFWRWLMQSVLWKVRNRLIVTYLLMGLAPVVLFVALALIQIYVFSGQFAIFAANDVIEQERAHISSDNRAFAMHAAHILAANPKASSLTLPELDEPMADHQHSGISFAAFVNGRAIPLAQASPGDTTVLQPPMWMHNSFSGVVLDQGTLYLRAVDTQTIGKTTVTTITSLPLQKENVDQIAQGLGAVTIVPSLDVGTGEGEGAGKTHATVTFGAPKVGQDNVHMEVNGKQVSDEELRRYAVEGGSLPTAQHFYDIPVAFVAPLETLNWQTGQPVPTYARVVSRPSLLYQRLFITSLETAAVWRDVFIGIAIFFGLLELFAFFLAVRLNRTITRSIRDLYQATESIDHGDFTHRISVTRHDQLAALSRSFNNMTASLARLLDEQREKERLQNELSIAQEVQANLFPRSSINLPMLELHGACYPARTVSGDYYDFLVFGDAGLGIALGDISGKGISAALLMATLHSAVRAYRFAGEELVIAGGEAETVPATQLFGEAEVECGGLFEEPGRILSLLNRHLYRSTQPEKYATLFLAHYDGVNRRLIYSTGGHLPPLLLRADDSVARLDCGGTVVGLIDNMSYEQGIEGLKAGDILIAYSDGVTEPENEFGEFGEERLLEIVRRHRHLSLEAISEQVMQSLRSWIGGQEQPDDITLVLARQR